MKILFVSSRFPYPPLRGDQARAFHFLRILSQRHDIVLLSPRVKGDRIWPNKVEAVCTKLELVPFSQSRAILRMPRAFTTRLPFQTLFYFPPLLEHRLRELVLHESFDLVHIQTIRMAPAAGAVQGIPLVIDLIDSASLNMTRRAARERGILRFICSYEAVRAREYERRLVKSTTQILVSAEADRDTIGAFANLQVVPNGVSMEDFPFVEEGRKPHTIVFTGRMGYFPNADAAVYFATKVFPLIRKDITESTFAIVGADPPARVRRLGSLPGVRVVGYVPSVHDYLAKAGVAVAPMLSGSGAQNKVLEAMSSGVPVVATPFALGGLRARPGEHVLIASSAECMASHIVRLMQDQGFARRLAMNARRLVEQEYSWERSVQCLEDVYRIALTAHMSK